MQRASHTAICSSIFDRSRTKICVYAPTCSPQRLTTCTCRNERSRATLRVRLEANTENGRQGEARLYIRAKMRQGVCGLYQRVRQEHYERQRTADESSEIEILSQPKRHTSTVCEEDVAAKEAEDLAERRLPDGSTTTRTVAAR